MMVACPGRVWHAAGRVGLYIGVGGLLLTILCLRVEEGS
jgi:hypothetical protein